MAAEIAFFGIAAFTIIVTLAMILDRNLFHSAVFLAFSFLGFGMFYFLLGAPLVGAVQILIYAGAVTMLLMFVIMLTKPEKAIPRGILFRLKESHPFSLFVALVVLALAVILISQAVSMSWRTGISGAELPIPEGGHAAAIAELMLGQFVLPFEVISLVLLAALVGAIVLARTDDSEISGRGGSQ